MRHHTENIRIIQMTILRELRLLQFPEEEVSELKKFLAGEYSLAEDLPYIIHFRQQTKKLIDTHKSRLVIDKAFSYDIILLIFGVLLISRSYMELKKEEDSYLFFQTIFRTVFGSLLSLISLLFTRNKILECSNKMSMLEQLLYSLDENLSVHDEKNGQHQAASSKLVLEIARPDQMAICLNQKSQLQSEHAFPLTLTEKKLFPIKLEEKSITYPYRKFVVGNYLHKILLAFVTLFLNNHFEQDGNILIKIAGSFFTIIAIKELTYLLDRNLLQWHVILRNRKKNEILNKISSFEPRIINFPRAEATLWGDIIIYGPAFLWLSGIISLSNLYYSPSECFRFISLVKSALVFMVVGSDGIINRIIIKKNNQRLIQKWDQSQLEILVQQQEKIITLIRDLFSIALPEVEHHWEQDKPSLDAVNTLTYFLHPHFKKNPNRMKLLKSVKTILRDHFLPPFEIRENHDYLEFLIPYLPDEMMGDISFLKKEIAELRPLIIRATEIFPLLKGFAWDVNCWWRSAGKIKQPSLLIRRGRLPAPMYEAMKVNFHTEYSPSQGGLLLYEIIPVELPCLPEREGKKEKPISDPTPQKERTHKKIPQRKDKGIAKKIAAIIKLLPQEGILPMKENQTCLRVKMPISLLHTQLKRLQGASITQSGNGTSLLIRFEKNIEIRVIGEIDKPPKKIKTKTTLSHIPALAIEPDPISSQTLSDQQSRENKQIEITVVHSGRTLLPIREPLSDENIDAILGAIATKLYEVSRKFYDFSDSHGKARILLTRFIKLSYIIKTMHTHLIIRAFGGIWRSLLMEEKPNDVDIVVFIPQEFDVEKDLFEKLKKLKVLTEYKKSDKPDVDLYTVIFLGTLQEITVFKIPSTEVHARTLNYNCNILSLEIQRFYSPHIEFYMPLNSPRFVRSIKNGKIPVIESVVNPEDHIFLLKNIHIKNQVIDILKIIFPNQKPDFIISMIEKLIENPQEYETLQPASVMGYLLTILTYVYDPKRIFNLLTLYLSNHYKISSIHYNIIFNFLIPKILNIVVTLEEKTTYPFMHRNQLFYYFREYLVKNNTRQPLQEPLLSDLDLLKIVLMAGTNLSVREKDDINKIFRESKSIYRDNQINLYLSGSLHSLTTHKRDTAAIDIFFTAITLIRTKEIFSLVNKTHHDPNTFAQCYLLPAFKRKRTAIATLFHYIPKEPEPISEILLNKWQEYVTKPDFPNPHRFMDWDSKNRPGNSNRVQRTNQYPSFA